MNSQKYVTTTAQNNKEQWASIRRFSESEGKAKQIYDTLNLFKELNNFMKNLHQWLVQKNTQYYNQSTRVKSCGHILR